MIELTPVEKPALEQVDPSSDGFKLPDIVSYYKNHRIFGLFDVGDGHKKAPRKMPHGGHQSATKEEDLWTWNKMCEHWKPGSYVSVSIPMLTKVSGYEPLIADLDEYKPDYNKEFGDTQLRCAVEDGVFVGISSSGKGKHIWRCTNEPLLMGGYYTRRLNDKGVDGLRTFVVMSGHVHSDGAAKPIILTPEERELVAKTKADYDGVRTSPATLFNDKGEMSPIVAANMQINMEAELGRAGFTTKDGRRWASPHGQTTAGGFLVPSKHGPWDVFVTYQETGLEWLIETKSGRVGDPVHLWAHNNGHTSQKSQIYNLARSFAAISEDGEVLADTVHAFNETVKAEALAAQAQAAAKSEEAANAAADQGDDDDWLDLPTSPTAQQRERPPEVKPMTIAAYNRLFPDETYVFPYHNPEAQLPGLLGALAGGLQRLSAVDVENGGLTACLPLLSCLVGDTMATGGRMTRSNMNIIALEDSGGGKTSLLNIIDDLLGRSELVAVKGASYFHSESGIRKMMHEANRPQVSYMDEIGKMFEKATQGLHGDPNMRSAISFLTKVYSASNGYDAGQAGSTTEKYPLDHPHLSIFGASTPEVFWKAFTSGNLSDGSIARYMAVPITDGRPQPVGDLRSWTATRDALAAHLKAFNTFVAARNGSKSDPYCFAWAPGVEEMRNKLHNTMEAAAICATEQGFGGAPSIIRRVAENAAKLALVQAVCRNYWNAANNPDMTITEADFNFGYSFAHWSALNMVNEIRKHGVGLGERGQKLEQLKVKIREHEESSKIDRLFNDQGLIQLGQFKSRVYPFMNWNKNEFYELIDELAESGQIVKLPAGTGSYTIQTIEKWTANKVLYIPAPYG